MKFLILVAVLLGLGIVIGLCWFSFKLLRETQKQAHKEHLEKIQQSSDK